ncbi:uncharacterized protein LOC112522485 [Cynara cardunculus var. scolymus]|uniref:Uncharacterized protein n=1 Tax=Cynara cardunculus var. scolymus TaxID=59895 RepID=A0A124SHL2_CYNCS|nr:uncharacterized protein LOC112522485 [Cynara cardunculus var. scolymus]KVI09883.1 hypothetical protein Ccrd_011733 [Cynara cardunculus var. scolymus]
MDHRKPQHGGSSFTENLFGPKDSPSTSTSTSSSSSGLFSSVFGPSSTGLGRDSSHSKNTGSSKKQEYGNGRHSAPDYKTQRGNGEKQGNPIYQNETVEPSYLSSSIYYGGQEVYSPNHQTSRPHHTFKKDGGDDDPNGSSASRGNWWQGSLYY